MAPMKILTAVVHVLLLAVIVLVVLTGYGITDYHIVEALTFGALSKSLSYRIHTLLIVPLVLLLAVHIGLVLWKKYKR